MVVRSCRTRGAPRLAARLLGVSLAIASAAALCSGQARAAGPILRIPPPVTAGPILAKPPASVWVAATGVNLVYRCTSTCAPVGSGWSEPVGMASDRRGNVYVADQNNSRIVVLNSSGTVARILRDPGEYPIGVAVAADGTVGVTNLCNTRSCGAGNIAFYAPHSERITSTATGLLLHFLLGAFDAAGDFYNDGVDASGNRLIGVVKAGTHTDTSTGYTAGVCAGMQVERNGVLAVLDEDTDTVDLFSNSGSIGAIPLTNASEPFTFAFTSGEADLWVADSGLDGAFEYANETGNPNNPSIALFRATFAEGVAVLPAD